MNSHMGFNKIILIHMKNQQSSRTIELPVVSAVNHQQYNKEKKDRIDLQKKRKQLQQTVSYLKRHAIETNKKFNQTQLDLWKMYQKKAQNYEISQKKNQKQNMNRKNIEERRNMSSLSRYMHSVKKGQAMKQLLARKKNQADAIKKNHQQREQMKKLNDSRIIQNRKSQEKNKWLNESVKNGTSSAKNKALNEKVKASKNVRNQMINLEQEIKNRELERIRNLQQKKAQLSEIVKKTRKNRDIAENIRLEVDDMDPKDVYNIVQPAKSKDNLSMRSLSRSLRKSTHKINPQ